MIKLDKKNIIITIILSSIILAGSIFLFLLYKEKSNILSYSKDKKEVKIHIFDKILKKDTNSIILSEKDPKDFIINRDVNLDTSCLFTYDKQNKKVLISTLDDEITINNNQYNTNIIIKEIDAEIGDLLIFSNNTLEVNEDLKSVFRLKDFINNLELKQNIIQEDSKNLLDKQNYSFESGLWSKNIDICEKNNNDQTIISQSLYYKCTDGKQCLNISSKNNTGCVSNFFTLDLKKDSVYRISFDYKQLIKDSTTSILFILMGSTGQNYYFTSNLNPGDDFRNFYYDFVTKEDIAGVIIKLNVTGNKDQESSVVFDNIKISESSKNKIIEIKKENTIKNYTFGKLSLKEGLNEFKAKPKNDSELSNNIFDYFLTFENKFQNSSFIKKINNQETISRLSLFFIFVSSILIILFNFILFKKQIELGFKKLINQFIKLFKIIIGYPINKIHEIKKEKPLFIILKILSVILIFGFYLFTNISKHHEINTLSSIALFYGVISMFFILESRISAFVAIVYLCLCPIFLIFKKDLVAEQMAVQAYYFLVITVITQIRENIKSKEDNKI